MADITQGNGLTSAKIPFRTIFSVQDAQVGTTAVLEVLLMLMC